MSRFCWLLWLGAQLVLLCSAGCKSGWSASELAEFKSICAGGRPDAGCDCMASEVPKQMSFADYRAFVAASRFEPGAKPLDEDTLKKMAHVAVQCTVPAAH